MTKTAKELQLMLILETKNQHCFHSSVDLQQQILDTIHKTKKKKKKKKNITVLFMPSVSIQQQNYTYMYIRERENRRYFPFFQ